VVSIIVLMCCLYVSALYVSIMAHQNSQMAVFAAVKAITNDQSILPRLSLLIVDG